MGRYEEALLRWIRFADFERPSARDTFKLFYGHSGRMASTRSTERRHHYCTLGDPPTIGVWPQQGLRTHTMSRFRKFASTIAPPPFENMAIGKGDWYSGSREDQGSTRRALAKMSSAPFSRVRLEELLKKRFFYAPAFSIYGGVAGLFDYGPPGCALQANMLSLWRNHFVLEENMLELDTTVLTPHDVLKAWGMWTASPTLWCVI